MATAIEAIYERLTTIEEALVMLKGELDTLTATVTGHGYRLDVIETNLQDNTEKISDLGFDLFGDGSASIIILQSSSGIFADRLLYPTISGAGGFVDVAVKYNGINLRLSGCDFGADRPFSQVVYLGIGTGVIYKADFTLQEDGETYSYKVTEYPIPAMSLDGTTLNITTK